jgi:hypothetical protein
MKKIRGFALGWLILIIMIVIVAAIGIAYYFLRNPYVPMTTALPSPTPTVSQSSSTENWQTYKNDKYQYTVRYPNDWYLHLTGYAPPPPETIMFTTKPEGDNTFPYASVEIFSIENAAVTDITKHPEVVDLVAKGAKMETATVDGLPAAKVSNQDTLAVHVSYYVKGNDDIIYRIGYQYPVNETNYASVCETIVKTFQTIEVNP